MTEQDKPNTTPKTIISHSSSVRRFDMRKKRALFLVVAIPLVIGGGVFYIYTMQERSKKVSRESVGDELPVQIPVDQIPKPTSEHGKIIAEADKLIGSRDHDGAINVLKSYEPKAQEPAQRYEVTARLGNIYFTQKNYRDALIWLERAQQTGQPGSDNLALSIAISAEQTGNKKKAIAAYRKAIELLEARPHPTSVESIAQYRAKIKALGG